MITDQFHAEDAPQMLHGVGDFLLDVMPQDKFLAFVVVVSGIAVFTIIGSTGRYLHELLTITVSMRATMIWRRRLFERLVHAPLEQIFEKGTSDGLSRVMFDTRIMSSGFDAMMGRTIEALLKGLVALMLALYLDIGLSAIALVAAALIGVIMRKFGKRIRRATERALNMQAHMVKALGESLTGIRVTKVHNAEGYERRRFTQLNKTLFGEEMTARQVRAIAPPVVDSISLFVVIIVATFGAYLILRRGEDFESLMMVIASLAIAGGSLKPLSRLHTTLHEAGAAAERVLSVLDYPVEPTGPDAPPDAPLLAPHRERVAFESVSYRYPNADVDAVRDVSLEAPFGATVAIVGGNGSGKTTLLSMLPRLIEPSVGRVTVDGVDIASVSMRSLRRQMAVVTQDSVLFQGTIADNIAYGRRYESRDRIVAAAKTACAHEFISKLPDGYDSLLGEGGSGLSGGQRQRICIARAVLRDPAILILDEATSQVDSESEALINEALDNIRQGRTTFIIAHRLSTVIDSDMIVVMDAGQIVDTGTHQELLDRCDIYRRLTRTQLAGSGA